MKKKLSTALFCAAVLAIVAGCKSEPEHQFASFDAPLKPTGTTKPSAITTTKTATAATTVIVTNQLDPAWLAAPTNLFTLGPGDRLEIELIDDPTTKVGTVVGPDGKIYFNLLPGIDVWGLSLSQAKAAIEQNLGNYIRGTPRVNLTLREVASKHVWLLGRLQAPGVYTMAAPMTLLEAITLAGGSASFVGTKDVGGGPLGEDLADLKHSFVVRHGKLLPVDLNALLNRGDLSQNIYLQPDDFVYFSPAFTKEVYVLGAVTQPKPVAYTEGMTLAAAIAGAYGTIRDAYLYHVVIVRGSVAKPEVTVVDYKAIMFGKAPDVALQPHDIVYVPLAPYRYLRKYAEIALNTFVSSVAINAGSKLGPGQSSVVITVGAPVGTQSTTPSAPPIH